MPVALEAVDLAALCAEVLAWALLTVTIILLGKLVSKMHFSIDLGVVSFEPLGWLADAISSYVLAGAEDARRAVEGAMRYTLEGLTWSFHEMLGLFTDLANATKQLALYLWTKIVRPYVQAAIRPITAAIARAEADVASLAKREAGDIARTVANLEAFGWKRLADAEGFTRTEVAAARKELGAAVNTVSSYVHTAEAGAIALPGTIEQDFGHLWDEVRKLVRPGDLTELLAGGALVGMLVRVIAQASGLDNAECQAKHKAICGTDLSKWLGLLEGLAALGFAFDFQELVRFAESLAGDVEPLVKAAA